MAYTDTHLRTDVNHRIRDATGGTVTTSVIRAYANAALRRLVRRHDIPTGEYKSAIKLYKGVYRYAAPTGYHDFIALLNGETMGSNLNFERRASEQEFFRDYPSGINRIAMAKDGASKFLLVNLIDINLTNVILHNCDTYDGNGMWEADTSDSDATNVASDTLYTTDGTGAIKFDVDVSQSVNNYAQVSVADMTAVDISGDALNGIAGITMDVWLPSLPSALSGFTIRFGSSASAYYEITVTSQAGGAAFTSGKNVLLLDWSSVTTPTGTPDLENVNYLAFKMNYNSDMEDLAGVRIDNIQVRQPFIGTLLYSSYYLILTASTNVPKEQVDSASDIFNIDAPYVDILLETVLKNIFTTHIEDDYMKEQASQNLEEAEKDLTERFPATRQPPSSQYMEEESVQKYLL